MPTQWAAHWLSHIYNITCQCGNSVASCWVSTIPGLWTGSNLASVQCFLCCLTIMLSVISASGMECAHGSMQTGEDYSNTTVIITAE